MTPQEMIDVIQAHMDGKPIQIRHRMRNNWTDCVPPSPMFDFSINAYRAKPAELRPHWPAIIQYGLKGYSITDRLYPTFEEADRDTGAGFKVVRLATEYPPVMLP